MQLIFDHLTATLVAGVLLLMLVGVNMRTRVAAFEVQSFYMLRQQQLNFIDVLEHDLQNIAEVVSVEEDPSLFTFTFRGRTDPADPAVYDIVYRRTWVETRNGVNFYRIERLVDGVAAGGSMSTITAWQIEARNEEGETVADAANARQVYIRFEAALPFREGDTVERVRWESTYRPPMIQNKEHI